MNFVVSEIAQHERPSAMAGLRISLHGIELTHLDVTSPCERVPVDGQCGGALPAPLKPDTGANGEPRDELFCRETLNNGDEAQLPAEGGWQRVQIDHRPLLHPRPRHPPECAQDIPVNTTRAFQLTADPLRGGQQSDPDALP